MKGSTKSFALLLAGSVATLTWAQVAQAQTQGGNPGNTEEAAAEEIIVTGLRASVQSAQNIKRNADTIVDSIVAEDVGKFPDGNVVESLARIPGVQIGRVEGEGATVRIRGLGNTKTVLNGRELFGGNSGGGYSSRDFSLGDLPSEVLAGVDVYKTSSADQVEGGLGGYINVRTRRPFDFKGFAFALSAKGTNYNRIRGFSDRIEPNISGMISDRWETGIGEIGILANVAYSKTSLTQDRQQVDQIATRDNFAGSGQSVTLPSFVFMNGTQNGTHERLTGVGSIQWKPSDSLSFYADAYYIKWTRKLDFTDMRLSMGTETSDYDLFPGSSDLQRGVFTNTHADDATAYADEHRTTQQYAIGGSWDNGGPLTVKFDVSHTNSKNTASLEEWDMSTNIPSLDFGIDKGGKIHSLITGVDMSNPANFKPIYDLSLVLGGRQKATTGTLDLEYKFGGNSLLKSIQAGFRYNDYQPVNQGYVSFYCVNTTFAGGAACGGGGLTSADIPAAFIKTYPSDAGNFVAWNVNAMRQFTDMRRYFGLPETETNHPDIYLRTKEKSSTLYGKLNFDVPLGGITFDGNLGVRYIHTSYASDSFGTSEATPGVFDVPQHVTSSRNDVLPTFNGRVKFGENTMLRFAVGKSFERMAFADLNGAVVITNAAQHEARRGNPNLQPIMSWNYDVSLEHYFGKTGLLYLAGFHKDVKGYLESATLTNQTLPGLSGNWTVYTKVNADSAKIDGIEAGAETFFDFLPAPFDGLGVQANYTHVHTSLEGLPSNAYNLIGMYEKGPISARVAYTWQDSIVIDRSRGIVLEPQGVLDASISYNVNDRLALTVDAANINGYQNTRYFDQRPTLPASEGLTDRRIGFQIRYKFGG